MSTSMRTLHSRPPSTQGALLTTHSSPQRSPRPPTRSHTLPTPCPTPRPPTPPNCTVAPRTCQFTDFVGRPKPPPRPPCPLPPEDDFVLLVIQDPSAAAT